MRLLPECFLRDLAGSGIVLLFASVVSLHAAAPPAAVELSADGRARLPVVIATDASDDVKALAAELAAGLRRKTPPGPDPPENPVPYQLIQSPISKPLPDPIPLKIQSPISKSSPLSVDRPVLIGTLNSFAQEGREVREGRSAIASRSSRPSCSSACGTPLTFTTGFLTA